MRVTGAAGAYSAGPLATAYPATGYTAGYTCVGASVAHGDAQLSDQGQAAQNSQTGTSYTASTRPSMARTDEPTAHRPPQTAQAQAVQVPTDVQRTGRATATVTSVHAICRPFLLVCLLQHQSKPLYPPEQHPPPPWEGDCPMTHHPGGHPPTNNESIPPTLGWCGTTQPTGMLRKTRAPSTHRLRRTTSPPTT